MAASSTAALSKAGQMRLKKAQGMSVGDIARLFNVTYHNAYAVVVTYAHRSSRVMEVQRNGQPANQPASQPASAGSSASAGSPASALRMLSPDELAALTEAALLAGVAVRGSTKNQKADWRAARDELDRRDPSGEWLSKVKRPG